VKWEQGTQHAKSNEQEREKEFLDIDRDMNFRNIEDTEGKLTP
jgi:hypothetical protein